METAAILVEASRMAVAPARLRSDAMRLLCASCARRRVAGRMSSLAAFSSAFPSTFLPTRPPTSFRRLYSTEQSADLKAAAAAAAQDSDVLERYRQRLEAVAQKKGVADIAELREAYADKIAELRKSDAVLPAGATIGIESDKAAADEATPATAEAEASQPAETQTQAQTPSQDAAQTAAQAEASSRGSGTRPLSTFLDLDKTRKLPAEELTAVWRLRFANDPLSLCAVIPAQTYATMEAAARARPQFVLPVPHPEQGAEIHFLQWAFDTQGPTGGASTSTVLFTQLAEYKLRGEFAQPHTTVTHYTDLVADCGVVLMHGQIDADRGVAPASAQWLVMCLQRFYGAWAIPGTTAASGAVSGIDEGALARRRLLQWFAAGDPQFTIERLMEEVEKLA